MIEFVFEKQPNGDFTAAKISGHADYAEYEHDIICSAVSALVLSTVNALEEYVGVDTHVEITEDCTFFEAESHNEEKRMKAQTLMAALYLSAKSLAEENSQYIKTLTVEEITND